MGRAAEIRLCLYQLIVFALLPTVFASNPSDVRKRAYLTVNYRDISKTKGCSANLLPIVTEVTYSSLGPLENAEGSLCLIDKDFFLKYRQPKEGKEWIGLIQDDDTDSAFSAMEEGEQSDKQRDNRGNRRSKYNRETKEKKSLSDKMKEIFLLGASALIIVVKNVGIHTEFDVTQVFSKPIVFIHGVENVTKILQLFSLRYDLFARIQENLPYYSVVGSIGTLTLWATCGRSTSGVYREWQGVVCIGNNQVSGRALDEYFSVMACNLIFLFFIFFIVYAYIKLARNGFEVLDDVPEMHQGNTESFTRHIMSQLSIEIYRSRGRTSTKRSKKISKDCKLKKFENQVDQCCICLESFFPLQRLRVLPCNHSFHIACIDKWLLLQLNCPMCKFDILDHRENL